jgi:hypothetical protein
MYKVLAMVTLWTILAVGVLTTIYPQQANAQRCNTGPVCGGNGGLGGTGVNGGTCTQTHCNASGGNSGNGGNGGNANVQYPQGKNGINGVGATPCVDGHRTLTSSDGRTVTQAC